MAVYYTAVDEIHKLYFDSPGDKSIKYPGICHPLNPFPNMIIFKNAKGFKFEIHNDDEITFWEDDEDYKDVGKEVYKEFLEEFPWADQHYFPEEKKTSSLKSDYKCLDELAIDPPKEKLPPPTWV